MSQSDDFDDFDFDDDALISAATQVENAAGREPRSAKRRKLLDNGAGGAVGATVVSKGAAAPVGNLNRRLQQNRSPPPPLPISLGSDSESDAFDPAPLQTPFERRRNGLQQGPAVLPKAPAIGSFVVANSTGLRGTNIQDRRVGGVVGGAKENARSTTYQVKPGFSSISNPNNVVSGVRPGFAAPGFHRPGISSRPLGEKESVSVSQTGVGLSRQKPRPENIPFIETSDEDDWFDSDPLSSVRAQRSKDVAATLPPVEKSATSTFDFAEELADLPSDTFSLSPASIQNQPNDATYYSPPKGRIALGPPGGMRQTTLFRTTGLQTARASEVTRRQNWPAANKPEPPTHHELDPESMKTWVYPINLGTIREYQYSIVSSGLFHNLLVALPTGLGKTFIAATIMLNWFRWTKSAQIVFVAPTKPLVSQQVEACFGIAGIPRSETTMLTGGVQTGLRAEEWKNKRVFFMTPQTLINDLKTGICDPKRIVLLVVDEAHRATGAYAYVEVVKFVRRFNEGFRVLALTATPGSDVDSVQKVIDGLDISRVEIRTEQSIDIRQYVHTRQIEKHVFDETEEMQLCMELYSKAAQSVLNKLNGQNAYWQKDPLFLTPFGLTKARQQWMTSDAGRTANWGLKSMIINIFATLASLAHSMELLKFHGLTPFYRCLVNFQNAQAEKGKSNKYRNEIIENENFRKLMNMLRGWTNKQDFIGHPKLEFLRSVILNHFLDAGEGRGLEAQPPSSTRVMIFAHYRDSAEDIVRVLKQNEPMIRPHVFVGQATAKNSEGMDQKRQLEIVHQFRTGVYNTLVATSIGEEGLDIGEVDLIVCYDSKASPIRMLQRMGRTGRKRAGKIVLLQMRGKEEKDAASAKENYERMQELIASGTSFTFHEERCRRIIPREITPVVDKCIVEIPFENTQADLPEPKRRNGRVPKRPPKKFHMPDGVRTGFVSASRLGDDDDNGDDDEDNQPRPVEPRPRAKQKAAPKQPIDYNEPILLEPLESIFLSKTEEKDLARRYQTILDADDDEEDVQWTTAPKLDAHPERQRRLSRAKAFKRPGRVTRSVVYTLNRMHTMNDARLSKFKARVCLDDIKGQPDDIYMDKTSVNENETQEDTEDESDIAYISAPSMPAPARKPSKAVPAKASSKAIPKATSKAAGNSAAKASSKPRGRKRAADDVTRFLADADAAPESSPPPSDPGMRFLSQAISLGSADTSGSDGPELELDSELASFIAGDEDPIELASSSVIPSSVSRNAWKETLFSSSLPQRRTEDEDEDEDENMDDDDDLPEISTLVGGRSKTSRTAKRTIAAISDDESDAEDTDVSLPALLRQQKRRRPIIDEEDDSDED